MSGHIGREYVSYPDLEDKHVCYWNARGLQRHIAIVHEMYIYIRIDLGFNMAQEGNDIRPRMLAGETVLFRRLLPPFGRRDAVRHERPTCSCRL